MPKIWGLSLLPSILVGLFLLFVLIPKVDPLKVNIERFRKYYDRFVAITIIFLFYVNLLSTLWNMGIRFNMIQFLVPVFGALFYYTGVLTENAKRNWFIGIRTPWTLSNEEVWEKTHSIGGKLFKIAGLIALLGFLFQDYAMLLVIIPVIAVSIYTTAYSYFEYQKQVSH